MSGAAWAQLALLVVLLAISIPLLGGYMAKVYGGGSAPGDRVFLPVERLIYKICRVDPDQEQRWTVYAFSVLAFSVVGIVVLYAMQRFQASLPLNPTDAPKVGEALSFNTATSFVTNTNWQSYSPESTLSNFTQMVGLTVQNFVSAAAGMAVMAALIRGLARRRANTIGNFWVDLTRTTLRILLPIAFVGALIYVSTGVVQNLHGFEVVKTIEGRTQVIPGGPNASQEIIKMVGTNGGGFFNVNAAHPFSNPNGFSDLFGLFLILVIPFALTYTYGKMVGEQRQGWVLLGGDGRDLGAHRRVHHDVRAQRQPEARRVEGRPIDDVELARRQLRRQGHSLRDAGVRAVGRVDDGDVEWLGELDARLLHAARRDDAPAAHAAG